MSLLQAVTFLSFWAVGLGLSKVEQSEISVSKEIKKSVNINCKISSTSFDTEAIHWYWKKPNKTLEHLIQVTSIKSPARGSLNGKGNKIEAKKYSQTSSSVLTIFSIEKEDAAMYYCAGWSTVLELLRQPTQDPLLGPEPSHILSYHNQLHSWAPSHRLPSLQPSCALQETIIGPGYRSSQLGPDIVIPNLQLTLFPKGF
ncbi:Hypothetical predicted protein [Marmota monax]|uniref:Ig-like domain-containing protein n=1 Tax=Marmota monax TaxID=9995 RepID=A0A5E4D566_MARMO|nr:T-cell receptor gamma chain V region V108B-like [Marmota monax]VTJ89136.1 Hypothetical predicted protein [Marmota monax]